MTPILFQAPDVGLIAPDLVIYLDVQPEVFCLYSLFFILFIYIYTRYSMFIFSIFCLYSKLVFHNEGARFFFSVLLHYLHTVVMIAIVQP